MSSTVAAVIVNFNSGGALASTLDTLEAGFAELDWETVVVDNASSDGSERTALNRENVRLLRGQRNVGFAAGVNAGIAATSAPFVLILNPDCRLTPGCVRGLLEVLQTHPTCAVIGPKILNLDGTLQESARGDPNMLTGLFGRTTHPVALVSELVDRPQKSCVGCRVIMQMPSRRVDWVSGACMLARRDALADVNGFDADYFLYWEDADICRRLRNAGWDTRYSQGLSWCTTLDSRAGAPRLGDSGISSERLPVFRYSRCDTVVASGTSSRVAS